MRKKKQLLFLALLSVGFVVAALLAGCSAETRQEALSYFFDLRTPVPPKSKVRRDLSGEIEQLKRELAETKRRLEQAQQEAAAGKDAAAGRKTPASQAKTWQEAAKILPSDESGQVNWVEALKTESVAPSPGIDLKAAEQAVLDLGVELKSSGSKLFSVTYEHEPHTQWLACKNCHPVIYPLGRPAKPSITTMATIGAGQSCGVCHGKVAFAVEGRCARCHRSIPAKSEWQPPEKVPKPIEKAKSWEEAAKLLPVTAGTTDWAKALATEVIAPRPGIDPKAQDQMVMPLDVERVPAAGAMFKAVFPHQAHTAVLACPNCHTAIFQMAKGATPMSMEKINAGQSCGVCHGKVAFPATACGRCHPAMAGGK